VLASAQSVNVVYRRATDKPFAEKEMMSGISKTRIGAAVLTLLTVATACSKKSNAAADSAAIAAAVVAPDSAAVAVTAAPGAPVSLTVASKPGVGVYLTDAAGRAVYVVDDGTGATIACTTDCATVLAPVTGTASAASSDTALKADLIGVTTLPDGTVQVTYAGKPLYYAAQDQGGNSITAQGKKVGKGTAHLVNPKGNRITAKG
jgi:predicted lipoprotein with Yx(FWY)xxD motif